MKIHFGLEDSKKDFDSIDIKDMDIDVIKKITLSDIYSFMSFLSRERTIPRARGQEKLQA